MQIKFYQMFFINGVEQRSFVKHLSIVAGTMTRICAYLSKNRDDSRREGRDSCYCPWRNGKFVNYKIEYQNL